MLGLYKFNFFLLKCCYIIQCLWEESSFFQMDQRSDHMLLILEGQMDVSAYLTSSWFKENIYSYRECVQVKFETEQRLDTIYVQREQKCKTHEKLKSLPVQGV